jgi:hypothetical protein
MGSDPQSYLQYQHDRDKQEFMRELRKQFPYAVYSGSEKYEYGPKRISAFTESQAQAEALIERMWPESGYWELLACPTLDTPNKSS